MRFNKKSIKKEGKNSLIEGWTYPNYRIALFLKYQIIGFLKASDGVRDLKRVIQMHSDT